MANATPADCTVRILKLSGAARHGTGFFVAPGLVLTCAHVVKPDPREEASDFELSIGGATWTVKPVHWNDNSLPDLALFRIPVADHPCLTLSTALEVGDPVSVDGWIARGGQIRREPVLGVYEGEASIRLLDPAPQEYALIKFKDAQIVSGMSGAALFSRRTQCACGLVIRTRNEAMAAGGYAVPLRTIYQAYPEIAQAQAEYHRAHPAQQLQHIVNPATAVTFDEKLEAVKMFPLGPAVAIEFIHPNLLALFYALEPDQTEETFQSANRLRFQTNSAGYPKHQICVPKPGDPKNVNPLAFWQQTMTSAATRGPRMLAAVFYSAPPGTFEGMETAVIELLAKLRSWPIR
ncbi:MAG TPA: serine protease [Terriglobales bacterium]|nr:serine protease [Terriglobales bacterium]